MSDSDWSDVLVGDLIERHFCGPSPDCEERQVFDDYEWGVLKTTAITWTGWDETAHKVLPRVFWNQPELEVRGGDVLVTKAGPRHRVGVVCHVPSTRSQLIVSGKMIALRPRHDLVTPLVLAGLIGRQQAQKYIHDRTTGMAESQVNFANGVLLRTPVCVPPPTEQVLISSILAALDAAIHETEAIIGKLKAVKQGLLHDLLTRGIDANDELRPSQAEAPHLYKESPLGWIPKEWAFGALQAWLAGKPRNGYSPQEAGEWTGTQMLGLGCLTNEGFEPVQLKPAPRGDRRLAAAMLADGDLLMSRSNTRDLVGLAGVYRDVGTPCTYPDLMMRLRTSSETSGEFLQFVLRSPRLRRQIQAHAVGTSGSMVKISGRIVSELAAAMPSKPEQERILSCLAAGDSRLEAEVERASVLRALKSGLMDDLLTGRVRVTPLLADVECEKECA